MNVHSHLSQNCPHGAPPIEALLAKYGANVPRYTSYPTAPHFDARFSASVYRSWLAGLDHNQPLSLYFHVPFCDQLCFYCGCHTTVAKSRTVVEAYTDDLIQEIALVAEGIGAPAPVASIHLGGGTPNTLAPNDLDRLFAALHGAFKLETDVEIAAEIDPRMLTVDWIAAASRNRLKRASLGVQDVNSDVQKAINRHQPWRVTAWAVDALRSAGVASINLDLMYGLPYQTVGSIRETVSRVIGLAPERIALFGYAHVPWIKAHQQLIDEAALPQAIERYRQQEAASEILVGSGYVRIGLDHFALRADPLAIALETGAVRRNFQGYTTDGAGTLLGLGASSIGRLPVGYVQNVSKTTDWRASIRAGQLATRRGFELSADDRMRADIISRLMCDLSVDLSEIAMRHRPASDELVAESTSALRPFIDDGLVFLDAERLIVTEVGRPFVRAICAIFDRYINNSAARHSAAI